MICLDEPGSGSSAGYVVRSHLIVTYMRDLQS